MIKRLIRGLVACGCVAKHSLYVGFETSEESYTTGWQSLLNALRKKVAPTLAALLSAVCDVFNALSASITPSVSSDSSSDAEGEGNVTCRS